MKEDENFFSFVADISVVLNTDVNEQNHRPQYEIVTIIYHYGTGYRTHCRILVSSTRIEKNRGDSQDSKLLGQISDTSYFTAEVLIHSCLTSITSRMSQVWEIPFRSSDLTCSDEQCSLSVVTKLLYYRWGCTDKPFTGATDQCSSNAAEQESTSFFLL